MVQYFVVLAIFLFRLGLHWTTGD